MLVYLTVFAFGLIVGSFLNAVIYRLNSGESIIKARSHCPKCGHVLAWYELMPVVSFVLQGGKCRACKDRISLQYPLVEIGTGAIFVLILIFSPYGRSPAGGEFLNLLYLLAIASLLIVIFVYDLRHYIIPDKIVYSGVGIAFLYNFLVFAKLNHWNLIENLEALYIPLLSSFLASAFFAAIYFISRGKWMGFGDVKLAFFMGLFLGWPNILVALFSAFVMGGIIGLGLIALGKKGLKSQVPFGPFLVAGTFVSLFWGERIALWYVNLLGL